MDSPTQVPGYAIVWIKFGCCSSAEKRTIKISLQPKRARECSMILHGLWRGGDRHPSSLSGTLEWTRVPLNVNRQGLPDCRATFASRVILPKRDPVGQRNRG